MNAIDRTTSWILASSEGGGSSNIFSAAYWFGSAGASAQAKETESLFMYILWVNIVSFVALMILIAYFVARYRRGKQAQNYQVSAAHNTPLELTWSIVPLMIMVPIFYWGFTGYVNKLAAPAASEEIRIIGQKWNWTAIYKSGAEANRENTELTKTQYSVPVIWVPKGRPVKLIMTSMDVLHAFYIPDFRTKMDVIPNRYTSMWFLPEELGTHEVFCAEYCGTNHSEMAAQIKVVEPELYESETLKWATGPSAEWSLLEYGKRLYKMKSCFTCHSDTGGPNTGPAWNNWFGHEHEYADGSKHLADDQWLRDNIINSQSHIVKGFPTSMPIYQGLLKPLEVEALVLYIQSLSDKKDQTKIDAANAKYEEDKQKAKK
ncbi:MAG: cytochrome c oxidase subunit II [Phycisphaerales bacterium]|nr:cytochrome c oxidase subunit II [Phycisphaerales bacterium]